MDRMVLRIAVVFFLIGGSVGWIAGITARKLHDISLTESLICRTHGISGKHDDEIGCCVTQTARAIAEKIRSGK